MAALQVIVDEQQSQRAQELGSWWLEELKQIPSPHDKEVRGKGLMIGVEINSPIVP